MPPPTLLQRLKERKLVQWALAYAAGAFVVFQLLDALAEPLALTPTIQRSILVIVAVGFFVSLVLAWYLFPCYTENSGSKRSTSRPLDASLSFHL